jgi:hypothetical protein
MKDTLGLVTAAKNTKALAGNAFKRPISSLLSLCMLVGLAATILSYSQTEGPQVAVQPEQPSVTMPVTRTITDTKGRTIEGTILGKSDTEITFQRKGDTKQFEIKLETLSPSDQEFIAALIPATQKKPTVLFLVDYNYRFPEYAEILKWVKSNDDYEVTLGMLYDSDFKLETHLQMGKVPAEEKNVILIKSGVDTDTYDILWIPRFNSNTYQGEKLSYFDIFKHRNQANKSIVVATDKKLSRKKYFVSKDAWDTAADTTEREAIRELDARKDEDGFVKTDENWLFYSKNLPEKSRNKLFKEVHENLGGKR